ncbi:EAL domain-containing protein [Oscillospiraceae bacterium BX1]|uniref:EAL domain-containing protein n=1 Tax=Yanshouia hominis TaxID=2763673 RepID=A0ABR7NIU0_9FIRM|nr:EAL domain-containing protein [Yanshouia hominis]MBC8576324.1 EAL domain-containing protein [Yanshouia hominis]
MADALSNGEFQIYLQPKYNLRTNRPEGAEALVRWFHPHEGHDFAGRFCPCF